MKQSDSVTCLPQAKERVISYVPSPRSDADGNQKATDMKISIHGRHEHQNRLWGIRKRNVIGWSLES
jgi:hypothetical protein